MGDPSTDGSGGGKKRRRRHGKRQQDGNDDAPSSYRGVSFLPRPPSGRPGSPHRCFEDSYDVAFDDDGASSSMNDGGIDDATNKSAEPSRGKQVVHRHLNGLCVVTAGNALDHLLDPNRDDKGKGDGQETSQRGVGIASVTYLVQVGKDSQSARGKLRTKRNCKRPKRVEEDEGAGGEHDGTVLPHDPLCRITFSNGVEVELRCCVAGTVIELNHRLCSDVAGGKCEGVGSAEDGDSPSNKVDASAENARGSGRLDPSLIAKDPLLDGHLAVIMPTAELKRVLLEGTTGHG